MVRVKLLLAAALLLLGPVRVHAALAENTTFEVRQAGAAANGGCFVEGASGTDFSQQAAAQYGASDLVLVTTTTMSSATHLFDASDIGNCIHITAGTGFTVGYYQILSQAAGVATVDRAAGTMGSTGGTYAVGGALALMSNITNTVSGNRVWVRADATYTVAASQTVALSTQIVIEGYGTTRGDGGSPTFQATASSVTVVNGLSGAGMIFANFILDCNNQAASAGLNSASDQKQFVNIVVTNCGATGIFINGPSTCIHCRVSGQFGGSPFFFGSQFGNTCVDCSAIYTGSSNATGIFNFNSGGFCIRCVGVGNAMTTTTDVFLFGANGGHVESGVCYNAGRDCYRMTASGASSLNVSIRNSIAYTAGGWCFNAPGGAATRNDFQAYFLDYNAVSATCALGEYNVIPAGPNDVTLTADPFTNAGANDFSLNNTSGGGAALKGSGFPGVSGVGTGFMDIGALQAQAASGGTPVNSGVVQ